MKKGRDYKELDPRVFANNIKNLRKSLPGSLTQGDFASKIGVSRSGYADWENKGHYLPHHDIMVRIIKTFGYSYDQLIFSDNMIKDGPLWDKSSMSSTYISENKALKEKINQLEETVSVFSEMRKLDAEKIKNYQEELEDAKLLIEKLKKNKPR